MKNILIKTMNNLSIKRPVFHSEADFQFSLGWELKVNESNFDIIMERPFQFKNIDYSQKIELDILVKNNNDIFGIELKYVTEKFIDTINSERFNLKDHAATNLRRYDFYKDISRLELLKENNEIKKGYVIFLTNVLSYKKHTNGMGGNFNFSDNYNILPSEYSWLKSPNINSIGKQRNSSLIIKNNYQCIWEEYSSKYKFNYILLEI